MAEPLFFTPTVIAKDPCRFAPLRHSAGFNFLFIGADDKIGNKIPMSLKSKASIAFGRRN